MKNLFYVFALFFVSITVSSQSNWLDFKSVEFAFRAEFPEEPVKSVQKVPTAVGEIDMHMFMLQSNDGNNVIYSVIRSDYPEEQFENADEEYNNSVLNGAVNGAVTNVKGKLVFDNNVVFNGYPGRSIKISIDQAYIYMNAYLIENTIYITQVICMKQKDENKDISRFLDSFDIIKVKGN